ncbi:MAG: hypothetical protein C4522_22535 [Desulfobacteraceae bacterium]|nr:MAG: hypothetical protein C4522_22535 [Desulfobacteraceae bacterium]
MITERMLADSFQDFWKELLPLLTPSCVHLLNRGHGMQLLNEQGVALSPVESREQTRDSAVVSEFAYHLAKEAFSLSLNVHDAFGLKDVCKNVQNRAVRLVNMYEGARVLPDTVLNIEELEEGLELAIRYESFVRHFGKNQKCVFQIPIQGAGFLRACSADMAIGDCLIEIKTVKRSLAGKDIRQLIIYLALSAASHETVWQQAGFFNPRRASYHVFRTTELLELLSGGRAAVDVFAELIDFICSSDVQLDSSF